MPVRVRGLKKVATNLFKYRQHIEKKGVRAALGRSARIYDRILRTLVPVDSGDLRKSIGYAIKQYKVQGSFLNLSYISAAVEDVSRVTGIVKGQFIPRIVPPHVYISWVDEGTEDRYRKKRSGAYVDRRGRVRYRRVERGGYTGRIDPGEFIKRATRAGEGQATFAFFEAMPVALDRAANTLDKKLGRDIARL